MSLVFSNQLLPPTLRTALSTMSIVAISAALLSRAAHAQQDGEHSLLPTWQFTGHGLRTAGSEGGVERFSGTGYQVAALSAERIVWEGEIVFSATTSGARYAGLHGSDFGTQSGLTRYDIFDFGFVLASGVARPVVYGTLIGSNRSYQASTVFKVRREFNSERSGFVVSFLIDNVVVATHSTRNFHGPLRAICTLNDSNSRISSFRILTDDRDLDSMPDAWERSVLPPSIGNTEFAAFDAQSDRDGDGVSNALEFRDGTNSVSNTSFMEPVRWSSLQNTILLSGSEGGLRKASGTQNTWNADSVSEQVILEDGKILFQAPSNSAVAVGFAASNTSRTRSDLIYAFFLAADGTVQVRRPENTTTHRAVGVYTADTLFAIERVAGRVTFYKDNIPVYTSTQLSNAPLFVDCSLYALQEQIDRCRIYDGDVDDDGMADAWEMLFLGADATYADLVAFEPNGDPDGDGLTHRQEYFDGTHPLERFLVQPTVTWVPSSANINVSVAAPWQVRKVAGSTSWTNADAVATRQIHDTGALAFNVGVGSHLAVGLTYENKSRSYTDLEYAFFCRPNGTVDVFTSGISATTAGQWDGNTRFSIRRVGGTVEFYKNGVLQHVAEVPVGRTLIADSSFYTVNSHFHSAMLYTGDLDDDGLPDAWELEQLRRMERHRVKQTGTAYQEPTYSDLVNFRAQDDWDGDGWNNRDEYRHSSDPLQGLVFPKAVTWAATHNRLLVNSTTGGITKTSGTNGTYNTLANASPTIPSRGTISFHAPPSGGIRVGLEDLLGGVSAVRLQLQLTSSAVSLLDETGSQTELGAYLDDTIFAFRRTRTALETLIDGVPVRALPMASPGSLGNPARLFQLDANIATLNHKLTGCYGTLEGDLDQDGMGDWFELDVIGLNATLAQLQAFQSSRDDDGDGVNNLQEYLLGTNPNSVDSDGDGMPDAWETLHQLNPLDPRDALVDTDSDRVINRDEFLLGSNPRHSDSDGDGFRDGDEVHSGLNPAVADDSFADKDGDGVPSLWEVARGTKANDSVSRPAIDAVIDADHSLQTVWNQLRAAHPTRDEFVIQAAVGIVPGGQANLQLQGARLLILGGGDAASFLIQGRQGSVVQDAAWTFHGTVMLHGLTLEGSQPITFRPGSAPGGTHALVINTIFRNLAPDRKEWGLAPLAGAIENQGAQCVVEHCTFVRRTWVGGYGELREAVHNGSGSLHLRNCVLWDDQYPQSPAIGGALPGIMVVNSLVQGGFGDNLSGDPKLYHQGYPSLQSNLLYQAGGPVIGYPRDRHDRARPALTPTIGAVQWAALAEEDQPPPWWNQQYFAQANFDPLADPDLDGLKNRAEYQNRTDPTKIDTDFDGLPDGWEVDNDLDPNDNTGDNGPNGDPDEDGHTNLQEFESDSNPSDPTSIPTPVTPPPPPPPPPVPQWPEGTVLAEVRGVTSTWDHHIPNPETGGYPVRYYICDEESNHEWWYHLGDEGPKAEGVRYSTHHPLTRTDYTTLAEVKDGLDVWPTEVGDHGWSIIGAPKESTALGSYWRTEILPPPNPGANCGGAPEQTEWQVEHVESVTLRIPIGSQHSTSGGSADNGIARLEAKTDVNGEEVRERLLPVEILQPRINADGSVGEFATVTEIRPTRWYDAFSGNSFVGLANDRDRLRIKLPDTLQSMSSPPIVKFGVTGITGTSTSETSDSPDKISLPGGELLDVNLVTDADDDNSYSVLGPEDGDWDTTHLSSLGAKAIIELHGLSVNPISIEAPVMAPVGKVELVVRVLSETGALAPAELAEVMKDCLVAGEIYAQLGIQVTAISIAGMPIHPTVQGLIADGDLDIGPGDPHDDAGLLLASLPSAINSKAIPVYYLRATINADAGGWRGYTQDVSADPLHGGTIVISMPSRVRSTLAHEIGHALGSESHEPVAMTHLLMKDGGTIFNSSHLDSKRFTRANEHTVKQGRRFYVPTH